MKIAIYGAGAVGGYVAVMLRRANVDVSVIARGPHLEAIRSKGLALEIDGERHVVELPATDDPAELGPQDYVFVTLKAHSMPGVVEAMTTLFHDTTAVVSGVNGIPWWYFHALDSPFANRHVESVDPGGAIWNKVGPERAIGCVVYPACELAEPGVVRHLSEDKFSVGEPDGSRSERVGELSTALIDAGLKAPVRPRLRDEIWIKLWGNLSFNPISALTLATLDVIATDPGTREIARAMMLEAQAIGEALGVKFRVDVDKRIAGAAAVGAHKTSMLQDLEQGRPLEIDALLGSMRELGKLVELPTPTIDMVHALLSQRVSA